MILKKKDLSNVRQKLGARVVRLRPLSNICVYNVGRIRSFMK